MRYIRFLKTPRIVAEKGTNKSHVYCLITITSDLGDSFFPLDVELAAELLSPKRFSQDSQESSGDEILVWRTIKWIAGMRTLAITLPLKKSYASNPLLVRVGLEPKSAYDTFDDLSQPDAHGIVSAWSASLNTPEGSKEAEKLVQRRFKIGRKVIRIWEETGESIARHLWDAGIAFSHHLSSLLTTSPTDPLSAALDTLHHNLSPASMPDPSNPNCPVDSNVPNNNDLEDLHVLELGSGCGVVGLTLASLVPGCKVHMTDLSSAAEIVAKNELETKGTRAEHSSTNFVELDWDEKIPAAFTAHACRLHAVVASDCTYNADSSPALVKTLKRLARISGSKMSVAIAMKMRHHSERVFFSLMADAGFAETATLAWPLPGDVELGEENVYLHVYRHSGEVGHARYASDSE